MLQINGALGSKCSILNTLRLVVNSTKIGNTLTHDNETSVAKIKINKRQCTTGDWNSFVGDVERLKYELVYFRTH